MDEVFGSDTSGLSLRSWRIIVSPRGSELLNLSHFKKSDGRYIEHSFNIFPEILLERREFASDPIVQIRLPVIEPRGFARVY
jgi:hypothetical protein